jgi:chromosomal replication initiator protein
MAGLEAGLRDRLSSGLTLRLQAPGLEARQELLRQTAALRGLQLSDEQLLQLAQKTEGPAPQMFRAIAEYQLSELPLTTTSATASAAATTTTAARPPLELKQIIAVVARYYSLTQAALRSAARRKSLVYARSVAIYLARTLTDQSYAQIGESLGHRDHSTIMHATRTLKKRLTNDAATQQDIEELKRILTAV